MSEARIETEQATHHVDVDVEVGIIIQSLMFRHREQQRDLAGAIGISAASLSRKLRGLTAFLPTELMRIARHYDVAAGDLMPVVPAGVAIGLPRMDSNHQPCGYGYSQVTDAELARWSSDLDLFAGEWRPRTAAQSWREWVLHAQLPSRALGFTELLRLVDRWDVRPGDSRVTAVMA